MLELGEGEKGRADYGVGCWWSGEVRFGKTLFSRNVEKDCGNAARVEDDLDVVDDDDDGDDDACRLMRMKIVLE